MKKKINSKKETVLVTGASRGIGKAIVKKLLQDGFRVVALAQHKEGLDALKKEYSKLGEIDTHTINLSSSEDVLKFTKNWKKSLYGIVNNAGICKIEHLDEKKDVWDEVLSTNLKGAYLLTKGLLKNLESPGRIVNISSQLGKEGRAGYGAYSASKFALIGLTKCWAKELGIKEITVNAVCPGWVDTEMSQIDLARIAKEKGKTTDEFYKEICAPLELKRFTTPEEVAELVAFLISKKASGITGRDMLLNTIWNQE